MKKKKLKDRKEIDISPIYGMEGKSLGVKCYRGFAPLSILSEMSMADEYHQINNPIGLQRELNKRHAKEAYSYARDYSNKGLAIWPEIVLNIRDKSPLNIKHLSPAKGPKEEELKFIKVQIDWDKINELKNNRKIAISRVDGNHRLYYTGGDFKNYPPLDDVFSPFCIMDGVSVEDERIIFRTINWEQKNLNVKHLLRIKQQSKTEDTLWEEDKPLWFVKKLREDKESPFFNEIHMGGKREKGEKYLINQKAVYDGTSQLLKNFTYQEQIENRNKLLSIVINYLNAIKEIWPEEWKDSKKYKLMTNTGLQALGITGGKLIGMLIPGSQLKKENFKEKLIRLKHEYPDFWESRGPYMEGKSGRPGSQSIAKEIVDTIDIFDDTELEV